MKSSQPITELKIKKCRIFAKILCFNVVSTQKIHSGCLKITFTDTNLVFLKNLYIFVVFFRGLVFVSGQTLANLV